MLWPHFLTPGDPRFMTWVRLWVRADAAACSWTNLRFCESQCKRQSESFTHRQVARLSELVLERHQLLVRERSAHAPWLSTNHSHALLLAAARRHQITWHHDDVIVLLLLLIITSVAVQLLWRQRSSWTAAAAAACCWRHCCNSKLHVTKIIRRWLLYKVLHVSVVMHIECFVYIQYQKTWTCKDCGCRMQIILGGYEWCMIEILLKYYEIILNHTKVWFLTIILFLPLPKVNVMNAGD